MGNITINPKRNNLKPRILESIHSGTVPQSLKSETSFLLIEYTVNGEGSSQCTWHGGSELQRFELVDPRKVGNQII